MSRVWDELHRHIQGTERVLIDYSGDWRCRIIDDGRGDVGFGGTPAAAFCHANDLDYDEIRRLARSDALDGSEGEERRCATCNHPINDHPIQEGEGGRIDICTRPIRGSDADEAGEVDVDCLMGTPADTDGCYRLLGSGELKTLSDCPVHADEPEGDETLPDDVWSQNAVETSAPTDEPVSVEGVSARQVIDGLLDWALSNRGTEHEFVTCYTYDSGDIPEPIQRAKRFLSERPTHADEPEGDEEARIVDTPTPDGCPGVVVEWQGGGKSVVHPPGADCPVHPERI